MADQTQNSELNQALRDLWSLPEGTRGQVLGKFSPEARQGLFRRISAPGSGFTLGEQYQFKKALGLLPQVTQTNLLPPATKDQTALGRTGQAVGSVLSGELVGRLRQRLGEVAQESGQLAQQYQQGGPKFVQGQYAGERGPGELVVNDLLSGLYGTTQVGAKLAAGFTDPKTLAAFIVSKLGPAGAVAAATYFGYQGVSGLADAIRSGKLTPESLQNGLLGMAGVAGSAGMAGEAGKGQVIAPMKPTPAEIRASVRATGKSIAEPAGELVRPLARSITGASRALREQVFKEAQQHPVDVKAQQEAVTVQRQIETQSREVKNQVEGVESKVYREADRRFNDVRKAVGAGQPGEPTLPSEPLLQTVRDAEASFEGHPESITLFRQIMKLEGEEEKATTPELRRQAMEKRGIQGDYEDLAPDEKKFVDQMTERYGALQAADPVTWDKLQRIKTSAEEAMRKPSTPPIVKRALRSVDQTTVDMMGQMADRVPGARAQWQAARDFWREWREDFHTPSGPMGSRSPLTGIRNAVDPNMIRNEIMRTQGVDIGENRAAQLLRKYPQFGGHEAAQSIDRIVETHRGAAPEALKPGALRPVREPTVNAEAVSRKALEQRAAQWGTMNRRDLGIIGSGVVGAVVGFALKQDASTIGTAFLAYETTGLTVPRLLERPGMQDWLLRRVPPEEMTALRKIPGADKVRVINTITDMGVEAARRGMIRAGRGRGGGRFLSPELQNFIGDANVQRILAAAPSSRPPGQQIRDLRKIQERFSDNPHMPIGPGQ